MQTQKSTEKEYWGSIQPEVDQWFTKWGEAQYSAINQVLTECQNDLNKGSSKDALTRLKSYARTLNKNEEPEWFNELEQISAQIPEVVILPQEERHFNVEEDDTAYVRFVKSFKRIRRTLRNSFFAVKNTFLKLAKKKLSKLLFLNEQYHLETWCFYKVFIPRTSLNGGIKRYQLLALIC